jgi:hypothetical protein
VFNSRFKTALSGLLFVIFFNWSCTKIDTTNLGQNLIPVVDNIHTFDTTLSVIANNFDSVQKDCAKVYPDGLFALGYIKSDPYFGTTQGTIFTTLEPPYFPFSFPSGSTIDSVVLSFAYKVSFGDSTIPQKVDVYSILGAFKPDSSSCTFTEFDQLLGSAIYTPKNLNDTTPLRIPLDNSFGMSLLSHDSAHAWANDSAFKVFMSGFALVPGFAFGGNALTYYSLADSNTKISVYYKYTKDSVISAVTNFTFTDLISADNFITRNHSGAEITNHLSQPSGGDDEIYIQTNPGTYAQIKIPEISNLSNRVINRAELVMDQIYDPADISFITPNYLYLQVEDTSGNARAIPCDFNTLSGTPNLGQFGGFRTYVKDPFGNTISRYTFNISRYVQKIVTTHRPSSTLKLSSPSYIDIPAAYVDECTQPVSALLYQINQYTLGRVKLGGGNNPNYRMKLHIIYSAL